MHNSNFDLEKCLIKESAGGIFLMKYGERFLREKKNPKFSGCEFNNSTFFSVEKIFAVNVFPVSNIWITLYRILVLNPVF